MNQDTKKKIILLVEDEVVIALEEAQKIRGFGYDVIVTNSGDEAVKTATGSAGIDLILMDIDLGSGTSGPEAAQQILKRRHMPIVFLTSHAEREMVERVRGITRYGYVIKNSGNFVLQSSIEMAFELFGANEKMRESEERYRAIFENTGTSMFLIEEDTTISMVNGEFTRHSGYSRDEIEGKIKWTMLVHPDDLDRMLEQHRLRREAGDGALPGYELRYRTKSGAFRDALITVELVRGTVKSIASIIDITDRKRIEEELILKSLVLDQVKDHVTITDLNGKIIYANQAQVDILESSKQELVGQSTKIYGEDADQGPTQQEIIEKTLRDGVWQGDIVNYAADGSEHIMALRTQLVHDANGKVIVLCGTATDITERKRIEEKLKFSEEKFLQSFMMSPAVLCIARLKDFKIIEINDTFLRKSGYSREEIVDKTAPELLVWENPADRQEAVAALMTEGRICGKEFGFRARDGRRFIGDYSAFLISIGGEKHILVSIIDITERKLAEEKIRALLSEKETLLREVHHRIKNNMGTMTSLLSLQAETLKEQTAINALLEARSRIQSMSVLYDMLYQTENVREMSIGHYLPTLVERIASLFPVSAAVTIKKLIDDFTLDVKTLSSLGIIVNELVTNAMKYAFIGRDKGSITVSTLKGLDRATLVIEDNGIGIPESIDIEYSAGFGLKLVGILVKQISGDVTIERSGGTRFIITFPLPS